MPRGRPPQRPGWATRILPHIPDQSTDRWISTADLMDATGLGYMQVQAGIKYLRDNYPEYPLISSPLGYRFSIDAREMRAFVKWRLTTSFTVMQRCYRGAVAPYLRVVPGNTYGPLVERQFERLLQDMGDLLASTT